MADWRGRFDDTDGDPMASMATLVDVMLVFACGLMAALVLNQGRAGSASSGGQDVQRSQQLERPPEGVGQAGGGYAPVGRVFRDRTTGKLILVESAGKPSP